MKLASLWHEVEPLFKHAFSGAVLLILKSGIVRLLNASLDESEKASFRWLDEKGTLVIFALLIVYTITLLAIRMYKSLKKEATSDLE